MKRLLRHKELLRAEYEYEKAQFRRDTELQGVARKVRRGECWYPVSLGRSYYNSLDRLVVELTRPASDDEDTPHSFEYGRTICFFEQDGAGTLSYLPFTATVSFVDGDTMTVILPDEKALAQLQHLERPGVQLHFDETTYRLMFEALDAVLAAKILSGADPEASNANGGAGGRATIDEMLHSYFSPTELVRIKNPFTHDTGWAYSDPKDIKIEQPSAETRRVYGIGKGFQKVRIIHAGEDIVIAGWEAYVGLTRMFKAWVQEMDDVRNMNNTLTFKKFMDIAYLGTFDPNAGKNMPTILSPEEELEADLGLI